MGISADDLRAIDAYFRAANYLTVGQVYLQANPLLREPLRPEHIKPRLLGHWGTSPGLNLIYAHVNRLIRERGASAIFLAGPGHGGPAVLANVYLEGTYSEIYPAIAQSVDGMRRLFRQFSTPGGIPSHVSPPTPGSIHEGGELGYVLTHAFGAVFDNPDLLAVAVVGDGEAETGPLEGSWKGVSFLNPARDGAVLPVLHLNGYKISGPTVLGRASDESIRSLLAGHGYDVRFVEGDEPMRVHASFAAAIDESWTKIRAIQEDARARGVKTKPVWPAIVLRTPKGWTGPKVVDGVRVEGTFRAHQVPLAGVRENAEHLRMLEAWMKSYEPEKLFDDGGRLAPELAALAPRGKMRMGASPHANGGALTVPLSMPDFSSYAVAVEAPGTALRESTRQLGLMLRDIMTKNAAEKNFRLFCPDETNSNRLGAVFEVENRCFVEPTFDFDDHVSPTGRVMEVLSEHNCQGWLEGYLLTGRHGLFATYEAFALIIASMATQHAKWLEACERLPWRKPVPSLNYLLTSTCWRNDHNGFSHQGPGFMDTIVSKKGTVARVYLPPDANCLLSVADHCLRSRSYVNLIIIDKQPQLQWLDIAAAREHCARGASVWNWAGTEAPNEEPDVVLACAGDTPTLETVAAAGWLRKHAPELRVRVVNVVDLLALFSPREHPHGMPEERFVELFTRETHVCFSFHGYASAIHQLLHARPNASRFHVRGYKEEGTTTTPFDMVVLNQTSRYDICMDAIRRSRRPLRGASELTARCEEMLARHHAYVGEHLEDMPEIPRLDVDTGVSSFNVLALNAGSSSLKVGLFAIDARGDDQCLARAEVERIAKEEGKIAVKDGGGRLLTEHEGSSADHAQAMHAVLEAFERASLPAPDAIGHRFVHGGPRYAAPVRVDAGVRASLEELVRFAPLHLPSELALLDAATERFAKLAQVVCFDTAFHRGLPEVAARFGLPRDLFDEGVRRYGFHGLSYEYVVETVGAESLGRAVIAHLGSGASLAAVADGRSIDTTMGLTPTGGLLMGTRTGDLDPGVLVHLMDHHGYGPRELEKLVNDRSGLLGVSGTASDMKTLLDASADDPRAALAVEMFCYTARKFIGALAAALEGLETLVFTGGIGERSVRIPAIVNTWTAHREHPVIGAKRRAPIGAKRRVLFGLCPVVDDPFYDAPRRVLGGGVRVQPSVPSLVLRREGPLRASL